MSSQHSSAQRPSAQHAGAKDATRAELEHALTRTGCAVCRRSRLEVERALDFTLYEMVNEDKVRREVRAGLGYCNRHAWQLREVRSSALGMALLYRDALHELEAQLDRLPLPQPRTRMDKFHAQAQEATTPRKECAACTLQAEIEGRYLATFMSALTEPSFVERFRQSDGLCRLHLKQALGKTTDAETARALLEAQREIHRRLLGQLNELIRKSEYRAERQEFGPEGESWLRAVELLSSPKGAQ